MNIACMGDGLRQKKMYVFSYVGGKSKKKVKKK